MDEALYSVDATDTTRSCVCSATLRTSCERKNHKHTPTKTRHRHEKTAVHFRNIVIPAKQSMAQVALMPVGRPTEKRLYTKRVRKE